MDGGANLFKSMDPAKCSIVIKDTRTSNTLKGDLRTWNWPRHITVIRSKSILIIYEHYTDFFW